MPRAVPTPKMVNVVLPGYYLVRFVPGGWEVPARITAEQGAFIFEHDGTRIERPVTSEEAWSLTVPWLAGEQIDPIARILLFGQPCTETEYRHRLATKTWAEQHEPAHPSLHPFKPIDGRLLPARDF